MSDIVPCSTCGEPSWPTCRQCANCWEVESRLEKYLKSKKGKSFVELALLNSTKNKEIANHGS